MLQRNRIATGLVFGLLLPALSFLLLYQFFSLLEAGGAASGRGFSPNFRERTVAIIAIAFNLLPLNIFRTRRWEAAMRGVVIATAAYAFVWLFRYGIHLF
jgi:hypothetical protein